MRIALFITLATLFFNSCREGCKDKRACNYNSKKILKGTCTYDPGNIKTASVPRSYHGFSAWGLDLVTGSVIHSSNAVPKKDLLYFNADTSNIGHSILHLEGSESVSDLGQVIGLCEVNDKSTPYGSPLANESHGYIVYLSSTNTYARVYIEEHVEYRVEIKYEYPF